jgi:cytochrome P450
MIKHGLNQTECETEGLFMIIAGTESTASAIRSALVHTITSPLVYQRLKLEISAAVHEGRASTPISMAEAKKLPYLQVSVPSVDSCLPNSSPC